MKYIIICKNCGRILMKTDEPVVATLKIKIQCLKCERFLQLPDDIEVKIEKKRPVDNSIS